MGDGLEANPQNAWLHYQASVYGEWLRAGDSGAVRRVLKTDAFEACGMEPLAAVFGDALVVYMDVSPRILTEARARRPAARIGCATDLRRIGFRPASFDMIFSPSSLDHFADERDVADGRRSLLQTLRAH